MQGVNTRIQFTEAELSALAHMPQHVMVLNHMIRFGTITGEEARYYYGITRLPAKIWHLRNKYDPPVQIKVEKVRVKNRFGKETDIAKYSLED